jgi:hypothetical protein
LESFELYYKKSFKQIHHLHKVKWKIFIHNCENKMVMVGEVQVNGDFSSSDSDDSGSDSNKSDEGESS